MSFTLSRLMSAATVGYAGYCLVRPGHVARAMEITGPEAVHLDTVARTYGVRDLAIGVLGLTGDPERVQLSMLLRIAMDLGDAAVLSVVAPSQTRGKVLGVTVGYAAVNALALLVDRSRLDLDLR